jgi:capsule polysaccharide export protein KpsC/LpsZ
VIVGLLILGFVVGLIAGWVLCDQRLEREYRMLDRSWAALNDALEEGR